MKRIALFAGLSLALFSSSVLAGHDVIADAIRGGMLDPKTPIDKRLAYVADIEVVAQRDKNPYLLYVLGSLYRQGRDSDSVPVVKDLDRAREYLSRAALSGSVPAMGKLSSIELTARNRFEANVWAQLHFHYSKEQGVVDPNWNERFGASILASAQDGFPQSETVALNESVGMMIARYDVAIRKGLQIRSDEVANHPLRDLRQRQRRLTPLQSNHVNRKPAAGMAEYYVTFSADGKVGKMWNLDAWPDPKVARILRPIAMGYRISAETAATAGDAIVLLPIAIDDPRYMIRKE